MWSLFGMDGLPAAQRSMAGDVLHPTAIGNHALLCQHVIKVSGIELCESILLGDVDLEKYIKFNNSPNLIF